MKTGGQKTKTCKAGEWKGVRRNRSEAKWPSSCDTHVTHEENTLFPPTLHPRLIYLSGGWTRMTSPPISQPPLLIPHHSWGRSEPVVPHITPTSEPHPTHPLACLTPHPLVNIPSLLKESHKTQSPLGRWCSTNPLAHSFRFQGKCRLAGQKFKDKKKMKKEEEKKKNSAWVFNLKVRQGVPWSKKR